MTKKESNLKTSFYIWSATVFIASYLCGINLIVPTFLMLIAGYFYITNKNPSRALFLNTALLYLITLVTGYYCIKNKLPIFVIPFTLAPMLATLLFLDLDIARFIAVAGGISVAFIPNAPFMVLPFFIVNGILSSYFVYKARKRSTIIKSGAAIGLAQVLTLIFIERFWIGTPDRYLILFLNGLITAIVVLGVLPIFEYLFKTVTNISLLELADSNHPLLQRMILEAPGTYHHSLVVGNLSDAACKEIGANNLLARVGAYYHDIGKIEKAEYFSENQIIAQNKHDTLSPDMSKLIIMNHVKNGVELAKKYRITPSLIGFIQQHHGNSLVYYFYRRAIESLEEDSTIKEEGFRYPGPKPSTKETAIVLLADSVEAATRALKDPTVAKIEEVVHKVINNKFIDGQLDECDLKLKDIERISAVFIRILGAIYHSRIPYGDDKNTEHNHKKSAKEDLHFPDKDKKSNS
ncbi:MAG: HDIG domain-containing protein [Candidatus Omnitrophica bacterium]|nr:HDIG domain-containing protein [Candidatus Omnitrophota bacterium]